MNSRAKGAVAEREVAAILQTWWRQIEPECLFVRAPASGGWQGPKAREAFNAAGDLMSTAQRWPFCVEVKRRENWSMRNLAAGMPSPVWSWWRQAQKAATEVHKVPLLVFRKSREPWRVIVPERVLMRVRNHWPLQRLMDHDTGWAPVDLLRVKVGQHPAMTSLERLLLVQPTYVECCCADAQQVSD